MDLPKIRRKSSFVCPDIISLELLESELENASKASPSSSSRAERSSRPSSDKSLETHQKSFDLSKSSTNSQSCQNFVKSSSNDKMSSSCRRGCSSCAKSQPESSIRVRRTESLDNMSNCHPDAIESKLPRWQTNQTETTRKLDGVQNKDNRGRLNETKNKACANSKKVHFVDNKSWAKSKWQEAVQKISRKTSVYPTLNLDRSRSASRIPRLSSSFIQKKLGLETDDKKEDASEIDSGYSEDGTRLEEVDDNQDINSKCNTVSIYDNKTVETLPRICNDKIEETISLISNEKNEENLSLIVDQFLEIKELSVETCMLREKVARLEEQLIAKPNVNMLKERLTIMENRFEECSTFKYEIEEENYDIFNQIKALEEEIEEAQNYFRDDINEADEAKRSKWQLAKMMKTVRALQLKIKKAEMLQQIITQQKEDLKKMEDLENRAVWTKVALSAVILLSTIGIKYGL